MKKEAAPKKSTGRKCSICSHDKAKQINSAINGEKSFRAISRQFFGDDSARESVRRHTENCPKLQISALIKQKKIENAVDHYREIGEQLAFAKELRIAAREYLSDPDTGLLNLIPRSSEISVIYEDYADISPKGNPKKKTDSLDILLERAKHGNIEPIRTIIKHVNIRSFALDSIRTTDVVLDKIFKLEGLYQKDRENDDAVSKLKLLIENRAQDKNVSYQEELKNFLDNYSDDVMPEIRTKLASELIQ